MWRGEPSNATDVDFYVVDFQAKYASGVSSVYDIKQMFLPIIEPKFNRIVMRQEIVPVNKTMPEKSQEKAAEKRAVSTKNKKNKNTFKNKGKILPGAKTANTQSDLLQHFFLFNIFTSCSNKIVDHLSLRPLRNFIQMYFGLFS